MVIAKSFRPVDFCRYVLWRVKTAWRCRQFPRYDGDHNKIYWLNPNAIEKVLVFPREQTPLYERGIVVGGDWDRCTIEWDEFDAWIAFRDHFQRGCAWSETIWYNKLLEQIEGGRPVFASRTKQDLDAHFKETDTLYRSIKCEGYRQQVDLHPTLLPNVAFQDEIHVHIDRNGRYLFGDGRHRLCIARLLNLTEIPVRVARRHADWISFRQKILSYAEGMNGKVYQRLTHPDLTDIPYFHGDERFAAILQSLPLSTGTVLDIDANWGYHCCQFEKSGFACTAVESSPVNSFFLKRLRGAENYDYKIVEGSIFDLDGCLKYDVVLALNIFRHFLKNRKDYTRLLQLLERIDTSYLFLETHLPDEPQMKDAYANLAPSEFADLVASKCHLPSCRCLMKTWDGRQLFMLMK